MRIACGPHRGLAPVQCAAAYGRHTSVAAYGRYASHPSLLFWSFGNELNGVWNGFLQQLGKATDQPPCAWDERCDDLE